MRFHLIAIIVFMLATLMGGSASFAESSDNNEVQKNLLIGSWYMPEPFVATEQGITLSFSNMKVSYLSDGTSEGSSSMSFVSGNGIEGMRQSGMSLTYHIETVTNWSLNDGVITDDINEAVITPDQSDAVSKGVAASMRNGFLSAPPEKYELILVSKTNLTLKGGKTGIVIEYARVAD